MIIYIMECGCCLKKEELKILSDKTYRCPEHQKGRIKKIRKKCLDCNKELILTPKQGGIIRCKECQTKTTTKMKIESDRKKYIKKINNKEKTLDNSINLELYAQGLSRYLKK